MRLFPAPRDRCIVGAAAIKGPGSVYPPQRLGRLVVPGAEPSLRALWKGLRPSEEASASSSEILTSRWEGLLSCRAARQVFDDAA
jgi:hypothetical protein